MIERLNETNLDQLPPFNEIDTENIEKNLSIHDINIMKKTNIVGHIPYLTTGDGNCLFNAASISLYGNESKSRLLKQITGKYFAANSQRLRNHHAYYPFSQFFDESDLDTMRSCVVDGAYSNALTILALVNALNISVNSIYPPLNGHGDLAYQTLNASIDPIENQAIKQITIMWSAAMLTPYGNELVFKPNHYVAVLPSTYYIFTII